MNFLLIHCFFSSLDSGKRVIDNKDTDSNISTNIDQQLYLNVLEHTMRQFVTSSCVHDWTAFFSLQVSIKDVKKGKD